MSQATKEIFVDDVIPLAANGHAQAVQWYRNAAEQGHKRAKQTLIDLGVSP